MVDGRGELDSASLTEGEEINLHVFKRFCQGFNTKAYCYRGAAFLKEGLGGYKQYTLNGGLHLLRPSILKLMPLRQQLGV
jgi:hypothetical protein